MFKHSFDTTAGNVYFPHALPGRLLVADAEGALMKPVFEKFPFITAVVEKNARTNTIPSFLQPFTTTVSGVETTYIDLRFYSSQLRRSQEGGLLFPTEGALGILLRRTLLEIEWCQAGTRQLMYSSDVPLVIFARWIKGLLAKKLNLNEETAAKIEILIGYYYLSLFITEEELTEKQVEVFAIKLNRNFRQPFQKIMEWISPIGYLANLQDLADCLVSFGGSNALSGLSKSVLWSLTSTSWFGSNDVKELLNIALEYPPAFTALVYAGATEKIYRKAFLTQVIEREGKKINTPNFIAQIDSIVRSMAVYPTQTR